MKCQEFLNYLKCSGVELSVRDDKLEVTGSKENLRGHDIELLRYFKPNLIALLSATTPNDSFKKLKDSNNEIRVALSDEELESLIKFIRLLSKVDGKLTL
ncbi:MAG: hypothetical protein EOP48_30800 [Sphingobacteriales bacterium]|nr:MAG: hypothetical protein EOP48_30800 [Sphingobacteriales bacterium]